MGTFLKLSTHKTNFAGSGPLALAESLRGENCHFRGARIAQFDESFGLWPLARRDTRLGSVCTQRSAIFD